MLQWCYLFRKINYALSLVLLVQGLCVTAPRRTHMKLRFAVSAICILLYSYFFINTWEWSGSVIVENNIRHNFAVQMSICVLILFQILFCYSIQAWDATFLVILAVYLQKIHFSLYMILDRGILNPDGAPLSTNFFTIVYLLTLIPIVIAASRFYGKNRASVYNGEDNQILIAALAVVQLLENFYEQHLFTNDPYSHMGVTMVASRLFSIANLCLILYLLHTLLMRKSLQNEKRVMKSLYAQRSQQYDYQRELMQSINIKDHDLKKLADYLRTHELEKEQLLDQLEDNIREYDALVNTANETLSLILTEKSLIFRRNQIGFSCMVCENDFRFMEELDIYTLFANLLDNALEASMKIEPHRRNVILVIKEQNNFLSIHQENYFDGVFLLDDGLPVTTKKDAMYHGFGTRSIAQVVERYGGSLRYDVQGNICRINILFPL